MQTPSRRTGPTGESPSLTGTRLKEAQEYQRRMDSDEDNDGSARFLTSKDTGKNEKYMSSIQKNIEKYERMKTKYENKLKNTESTSKGLKEHYENQIKRAEEGIDRNTKELESQKLRF